MATRLEEERDGLCVVVFTQPEATETEGESEGRSTNLLMGLFREEQYIQSFRSFRLPGNPSIHWHDLALELSSRGIALVGSVSSS